jgi:hypothetical protein
MFDGNKIKNLKSKCVWPLTFFHFWKFHWSPLVVQRVAAFGVNYTSSNYLAWSLFVLKACWQIHWCENGFMQVAECTKDKTLPVLDMPSSLTTNANSVGKLVARISHAQFLDHKCEFSRQLTTSEEFIMHIKYPYSVIWLEPRSGVELLPTPLHVPGSSPGTCIDFLHPCTMH